MDLLSTRHIAEHLCTLATLLEAEALRAGAFDLEPAPRLQRKAREVRSLADQLWKADSVLDITAQPACSAETKVVPNPSFQTAQPTRQARKAALQRQDGFMPSVAGKRASEAERSQNSASAHAPSKGDVVFMHRRRECAP